AQVRLLDLQELDSHADQLRHQRRSLPEAARLAELVEARALTDDQARDARIEVDDLAVEQAKVDADVEQVKARRERDQQRIDQGLISNPKDIQRMQQEMVSLERRITSLEDDEIEVMERLEEAQKTFDGLTAQMAETDEKIAAATASRDAKLAEIDAQVADLESRRGPVAGDLPADLLALYDRLREQKGGVGAALLRARSCGGCMLDIDNAELATIRAAAADDVIRCAECSRILVRTAESGL
ncbi:MAG TPA: C4-type zinc ribbon domain-containing protein, partial [Nocardioides sp.]|nr:C4-type zinc ribbon domain-containing protein [Nocardioides sp.]